LGASDDIVPTTFVFYLSNYRKKELTNFRPTLSFSVIDMSACFSEYFADFYVYTFVLGK